LQDGEINIAQETKSVNCVFALPFFLSIASKLPNNLQKEDDFKKLL